ncbi:MAG: hypothetical protein VYA30_11140 [Myxococcota bacterium]|nr:hypothetical protein [Myxococcota bacterium]
MSLVIRNVCTWILATHLFACQSQTKEKSGRLAHELLQAVRLENPSSLKTDPRHPIIKSSGLNIHRRVSALTGLALKARVELSLRNKDGLAFHLVEVSKTKVDIKGSWTHSIETTLKRQDGYDHTRVLRCLQINGQSMIKRESDSWIQFQPAHIYDRNCLENSLDWIPQLVETTQSDSRADVEADGPPNIWKTLILTRHDSPQIKTDTFPKEPFVWDILLDDDNQYSPSMLARYGSLQTLNARLEFESETGSIRAGDIAIEYGFNGKIPFTILIKVAVESDSFGELIKEPKHRIVRPPSSLKSTYEKLTGYEFNRANLRLGLQPSRKEPKVLPASKRTRGIKR